MLFSNGVKIIQVSLNARPEVILIIEPSMASNTTSWEAVRTLCPNLARKRQTYPTGMWRFVFCSLQVRYGLFKQSFDGTRAI